MEKKKTKVKTTDLPIKSKVFMEILEKELHNMFELEVRVVCLVWKEMGGHPLSYK